MIRIGTAGWSLYRAGESFPTGGTGLERYAQRLPAVEINSSFHRAHSVQTYARWAACTPARFRFSVKVPRSVTHEGRLRRSRAELRPFVDAVRGLGRRRGPLLVQLPPSLEFEPRVARRFFDTVRELYDGPLVCEPRHLSWFSDRAEALLDSRRVGRVAADPAITADAAHPGGWTGIAYWRLHGSPRKYWSAYETERLQGWATAMRQLPRRTEAWCIFDNTAGGAATANALALADLLGPVCK
jgi:uncharacterized protein YecE (DUF72 family)